ncbi:MAG: DUF2092 domain-containing protein [Verrucomicrobiota bacterium]
MITKTNRLLALTLVTTTFIASPLNAQDLSKVDPDAARVFAQGCEILSYSPNFSFKAKQTINPMLVQGSGRLGEIDLEVHVSRPDKLRAVARGTAGGQEIERQIFIHPLGSALSDVNSKIFVNLPASESIDEAVDEIRTHFSIPVPLIDFVVNDPYTNFASRLIDAKYLGTDEANGKECHHIIFLGKTMDWEVWISKDEILAQRFLISIKGIPGKNHIEAVFSDWDFGVEHDEAQFDFNPGDDFQLIGLPPAEFLGDPKETAAPAVPGSLDAANDPAAKAAPKTAKRTINRPHLFLIPPGSPTGEVNGQRTFIVEDQHYLPYLHDGGPVFIAIDPENPPTPSTLQN